MCISICLDSLMKHPDKMEYIHIFICAINTLGGIKNTTKKSENLCIEKKVNNKYS